jgi:CRISPR-associated protein Cas2
MRGDDHVLILDLGPADKVDPHVESLGKSFESVKRTAVVI